MSRLNHVTTNLLYVSREAYKCKVMSAVGALSLISAFHLQTFGMHNNLNTTLANKSLINTAGLKAKYNMLQ
jgi:hypothetical protein